MRAIQRCFRLNAIGSRFWLGGGGGVYFFVATQNAH